MSVGAKMGVGSPAVSTAGRPSLEDLPVPRFIRENYVLVSRDGADQKALSVPDMGTTPVERPGVSLMEKKDNLLGRGVGGGFSRAMVVATRAKRPQKLSLKMVQDFGTYTSSANSAFSSVAQLKPASNAEWSEAAGLFSEARCVGIDFLIAAGLTHISTDSVSPSPTAGFVFDPANSASLGAVAETLIFDHHLAPVMLLSSGLNSTSSSSTQSTSRGGWLKFSAKLSPGPTLNPDTSTEVVGGGWFATSATNAIIGYLKPYLEAVGAGGNAESWWRPIVVFHMEFRNRS